MAAAAASWDNGGTPRRVIAQPHTLVTLWFVSAATPAAILDAEPTPDRGFARKYLSQVNPAWQLTHIGDFDMTRSASPGVDEFYIGGFPGVSVVQMIVPGLLRLSELPVAFLSQVAAVEVYATAYVSTDPGESEDSAAYAGLGGFAHWTGGTLKRAFSATREQILEDVGLPDPVETPFWAGNADATGIQLPFIPHSLAKAAVESWLGFATDGSGPSIPINAFAVDGRPEVKSRPAHAEANRRASRGSGVGVGAGTGTVDGSSYDDYTPGAAPQTDVESAAELARRLAESAGRWAVRGAKHAWGGRYGVKNVGRALGSQIQKRAREIGRN